MSVTSVEVTHERTVIQQDLKIVINVSHDEMLELQNWLEGKKDDNEPACLYIIRNRL